MPKQGHKTVTALEKEPERKRESPWVLRAHTPSYEDQAARSRESPSLGTQLETLLHVAGSPSERRENICTPLPPGCSWAKG